MNEHVHKESIVKTWLVVFSLVALILAKGFFSFFIVSDRKMPDWDYRPGTWNTGIDMPYPQHVRGAKGE